MDTIDETPLNMREFVALADQRHPHSITIYGPMDLGGREQNEHHAQGLLKQSLKKVRSALRHWEVEPDAIEVLLEPVEQLLNNAELWRNPGMGLAIFLSPTSALKYFRVPIAMDQQTFIGSRYLLSPLLPLYMNDGQYYLLALSRDQVRYFEASRFRFRDLHLETKIPVSLEEAVGRDYRQKNLHYHSGRHGEGAVIHGTGEGKDDRKKELIRFLRLIHQGVHRQIAAGKNPLVLACVDELASAFAKVNQYPYLYENHLKGDPGDQSAGELHRESWELIQPYFEKSRVKKMEQLLDNLDTPRVSTEMTEIIPAAIQGKIDTLFLASGHAVYGLYDGEKQAVRVDPDQQVGNTSLTDLAAMSTFLQGGKAYFVPAGEMPVANTIINALY